MVYDDIKTYFEKNNIPKFRFKQLYNAIFKELVISFDDITVFPKSLREQLKQQFSITSLFLVQSHKSGNTIKFVLKTHDQQFIEAVLMLHKDGRRTVCVSSQVFCALGCKFCATGANQFKRSLTAQEIVEQVLFVSRYLNQFQQRVTNIVYMGMGEPFLAYNSVVDSIRVFNDKDAFNIGARHITASTSGIVPKIYQYAEMPEQTRLAISLHAPNNELRTELMPINQRYPLDELIKACDYYVEKTNKRISYEYVLIGEVNDSIEHAKELVELLKNRLAHVNLLIYNPHEFASYKMPQREKVLAFRDVLLQNNIEASIRKSMGDDISGACGQLSGKIIRERVQPEYFEN